MPLGFFSEAFFRKLKNDIDKRQKSKYDKRTRRRANLFSKGMFIPSIQNENKFIPKGGLIG